MTLFDRIAAGSLRNSQTRCAATLATFATDEPSVATVATVATSTKVKNLTLAQQTELRRLISQVCLPDEVDEMLAAALPFGADAIRVYEEVKADRELILRANP